MSEVYPETPLGSPPAAAATPGQAAYEAHAAMVVPRPWRWGQLDDKLRAAWEAAAQAVIAAGMAPGFAAHSLAARERDELAAKCDSLLAANQRWAETLGHVRQRHAEVKRQRDDARAELQEVHAALVAAYGRDDLTEGAEALLVGALASELDEARDERDRYRAALEAIAECRAGMPYPDAARAALEAR